MYPNLSKPKPELITLTYVIYGLHLFSVVSGLLSPALVVTAFVTGWPSLIAVILNYLKRGDVRGSFLESHFHWQLNTFWYALLWLIIGGLLAITVVGIPVAMLMLWGTGLWVLYRFVRGLLNLNNQEAMPI